MDEPTPGRWRQVDFTAGVVRLEPGTTKSGEGRTFPVTPELRACLQAQRPGTEALQTSTGSRDPVGIPPSRGADQALPAGVAHGLQARGNRT